MTSATAAKFDSPPLLRLACVQLRVNRIKGTKAKGLKIDDSNNTRRRI
jgi:hypothetical protein